MNHYFISQPASQPTIRPGSAKCMAPKFLQNKGNDIRFMKLLFQRMFILHTMVLPLLASFVCIDKVVGRVLINLLCQRQLLN